MTIYEQILCEAENGGNLSAIDAKIRSLCSEPTKAQKVLKVFLILCKFVGKVMKVGVFGAGLATIAAYAYDKYKNPGAGGSLGDGIAFGYDAMHRKASQIGQAIASKAAINSDIYKAGEDGSRDWGAIASDVGIKAVIAAVATLGIVGIAWLSIKGIKHIMKVMSQSLLQSQNIPEDQKQMIRKQMISELNSIKNSAQKPEDKAWADELIAIVNRDASSGSSSAKQESATTTKQESTTSDDDFSFLLNS